MISADPSSLSYRFFNAPSMRKLRAKFLRRKQHRTDHNSPEIHHQQETSHGPPGPLSRHDTDLRPPSESTLVPSFPDGVEVLHDCRDAAIDICFVHGLTGNRDSTWTAKGQSKPWPEALLPLKLTSARILTYGYDAYIVRKSVASTNGLIDHAKNLLNDLSTDRASSNASSRPLVFVAHSLGGLVCKEAVLLSRNNPESHLRGIFDCTKGIVFLGTPHRGSWMADWARIPASALGIVKSINKSLLKILETDDKYLQSVQDRFWSMVREQQKAGRDLEVTCFFEELPLSGVGKVVSKDSATLESYNAISIHANHSNMAKFSSVDDNGFKRLLGELIRWESQIRNSTVRKSRRPKEEAPITKSASSSFNNFGPGDQLNALGGTVNKSTGSGNHFPGATFSASVQFGKVGSEEDVSENV
ncbi:Alpha/Beta hydrolase protein [Fusarium oxysporum]|nr:Alpha/Beta hydrolase protein [Fusarium oxysporum]